MPTAAILVMWLLLVEAVANNDILLRRVFIVNDVTDC